MARLARVASFPTICLMLTIRSPKPQKTSLPSSRTISRRSTLSWAPTSTKERSKRWSRRFSKSTSRSTMKLRSVAESSRLPRTSAQGRKRSTKYKTSIKKRYSSKTRIDECSLWCKKKSERRVVISRSRCSHPRSSQPQSLPVEWSHKMWGNTTWRTRPRESRDREVTRYTNKTVNTWCLKLPSLWTMNHTRSITRHKIKTKTFLSPKHEARGPSTCTPENSVAASREAQLLTTTIGQRLQ